MVKTRRPRPKWIIRERHNFAAEIRLYRWIIRHGDVVDSLNDLLVWRTRISAVQYLVRRFGHRISTRIVGPLYTTRLPVTGRYNYSFSKNSKGLAWPPLTVAGHPSRIILDTVDYQKSKGE